MIAAHQHVWLGPEATTWESECEVCLHTRESLAAHHVHIEGTLRAEADVGFATCRRGHRIVVRRIGRRLARDSRVALPG